MTGRAGTDAAGRAPVWVAGELVERMDYVPSRDGTMPMFSVRPDRPGRFPVVLIHMDAVGFRHELKEFARRLARAGFYAILPNIYYRWGGPAFDTWEPERSLIWFRPMSYGLTPSMITYDSGLALDQAATDPTAAAGRVGCMGFCLGGRIALLTAASRPAQVGAAVSLYGGRQVTAAPDSPHRLAMQTKAEFYFGFAGLDHVVTAKERETLAEDFTAAGMTHAIEVFADAAHGFSFPERICYHPQAAERSWTCAIDLFQRRLT